jgi:hypothetical protein
LGQGQYGVFALEDIPPNTKFWKWTDLVQSIHHADLEDYIVTAFGNDVRQIQMFLRRGFVLPPPHDDYYCSNFSDGGSYMNHSSNPNCGQPYGTLRWIRKGEELTMDYSGNGNPQWFVKICHKYGMLTNVEIAKRQLELGERYEPALYNDADEEERKEET